MLRVPGSLNSKSLDKGLSTEDSKVKIIQEWDRKRVPFTYQLGTFHSYLVSERKKEEKRRAPLYTYRLDPRNPDNISWIEKLLETPIEDHRHLCLWHILIPYLVNVKSLPESEVILILEKWLDGCNSKRNLTFRPLQRIKTFVPLLNTSIQ